MLAAMNHVVPGQGIDFTALGKILLFVLGLYLVAALLQWIQGRMLTVAVNRTDLPAAPRRRGQAQPPGAALLRRPAAR